MLHSDNIETGMPGGMKVDELLPFVTEVVSAQLANNKTASANVAPLIQSVYKALQLPRASALVQRRAGSASKSKFDFPLPDHKGSRQC